MEWAPSTSCAGIVRARRPRPRCCADAFCVQLLLFFGILVIAGAIATKAFWRETTPPRVMASVYVVDGDSLRAGDEDIRLVGIDAPELRQTCRDGHGREWSCGRAAKARLAALVAQGDVACTSRGRDRYGRTLAVCSARNVPDLGETMVREGYAINFAIDYGGYPAAEREAQSARSGVWQGDFERPKDWRRRHPRT
ncbi:MAG: thermonuclease family protein [Pseudolabrys sp.]